MTLYKFFVNIREYESLAGVKNLKQLKALVMNVNWISNDSILLRLNLTASFFQAL